MISIGTGDSAYPNLTVGANGYVSQATWLLQIGRMITNIEAAVHEKLLSKYAYKSLRFQQFMANSINMASTAPDDIAQLIQYGKDLVLKNKKEIDQVLIDMITERIVETPYMYAC